MKIKSKVFLKLALCYAALILCIFLMTRFGIWKIDISFLMNSDFTAFLSVILTYTAEYLMPCLIAISYASLVFYILMGHPNRKKAMILNALCLIAPAILMIIAEAELSCIVSRFFGMYLPNALFFVGLIEIAAAFLFNIGKRKPKTEEPE